jgi:PBP1b-binding outer membrane lipoprotein LpoB
LTGADEYFIKSENEKIALLLLVLALLISGCVKSKVLDFPVKEEEATTSTEVKQS